METILAFFNHFPLFAIMLRIKDPHRLPGGLQFEIFQHDEFLLEHHGILHRLKHIWHKFQSTTANNNTNKSSSSSTSRKFKRKKQRSVSFAIPGAANTAAATPKNKPYHSTSSANHHNTKKKLIGKKSAYLWMRVRFSCKLCNLPAHIFIFLLEHAYSTRCYFFSVYVALEATERTLFFCLCIQLLALWRTY